MCSACKIWYKKRCHKWREDCWHCCHSYWKSYISTTEIWHDIWRNTSGTASDKYKSKSDSIRKSKNLCNSKSQERHYKILCDCTNTYIKWSFCQYFKILCCQCKTHTKHDNSDNDRLICKFICYKINKQLIINPWHHSRYKKCYNCNRYNNNRCIIR